MGDVIKRLLVRSHDKEKPKRLRLYFDTGSLYTFIKKSKAEKFKAVMPLPSPHPFRGLGDGSFYATHLISIQVKILEFWCLHYAYVVSSQILEDEYDMLVGHDFMQKFNIKLNPRERDIIVSRSSLKMAQIIR